MGWTFVNKYGETPKKFFAKEFFTDNDNVKIEMQDYASKGSTAYIAMRVTPKIQGKSWAGDYYVHNADGSYVFAMVVLTSRRKDRYYGTNFGYKEMEETMGPNESDAPLRILNQLSPIDPGQSSAARWALEWRARCRARAGA